MAEIVPVALVGCGHIHTPGFVKRLQARTDVRVVAVWDHDTVRAARYGRELNAPIRDLDAIWADTAIPAVIITAETNRHRELIEAAVAARKDLFVEKPLGMNAEEAYAMAHAIEAAGVRFQTGFFMRGNPVYRFLRDELRAGHFGTLTRVRASNCHAGVFKGFFDGDYRWMADPAVAGVGAYGDLGAHALDLLQWLLGIAVVSVTAQVRPATGRFGGCDKYGEGMLVFEGNVLATLAAGWVDIANPVTLELCGTEGHATVIDRQLWYQSTHVSGADGTAPWTALPPELPHAFELFLDAITGQPDVPLVTPREAAYGCAVMDACYEAARSQTWVVPRQA